MKKKRWKSQKQVDRTTADELLSEKVKLTTWGCRFVSAGYEVQ